MALQRAAEHGATPPPGRMPSDVNFYRVLTLLASITIGMSLAVLWNRQVVDPIAMAVQQGVVGTTTPVEAAGATALAFVAGASMIVTA